MKRIGVLGLGALALSGCQSDRPDPGAIAKEWSTNTAQLGIRPIYPPREVYPGDVFISVGYDVDSIEEIPTKAFNILPIRYSHVPNLKEVAALEKDRLRFPIDTSNTDAASFIGFPSNDERINCLVAFPGFTFASTSDVNLGANIPKSVWAAMFSTSSRSTYTVSYSVPKAECISYEVGNVRPRVNTYLARLGAGVISDIQDTAISLRIPQDIKEKYNAAPILVIPYEVYYARTLDVTVNALDGSSSQLSATALSLIELSDKKQKLEDKLLALTGTAASQGDGVDKGVGGAEGAAQQPAVVVPKTAAVAAPNAEVATDIPVAKPTATLPTEKPAAEQAPLVATIKAQIASVQQQLEAATKVLLPTVPGVTGSVTRISATGISLSQTFSIPVAIGYRSIQYSIPTAGPAVAKNIIPTSINEAFLSHTTPKLLDDKQPNPLPVTQGFRSSSLMP